MKTHIFWCLLIVFMGGGICLGSDASERQWKDEILNLWKSGEKKEAFQLIKEWKNEAKKSPDPWVLEATLYLEEGRWKKVKKLVKKALKYDPVHPEAYYLRARAFEATQKPLEAANEFRAALIARPDFEEAQKGLERVLNSLEKSIPLAGQTENQTQ